MLWTIEFSTFWAPPGSIVKSGRIHLLRGWDAGERGNYRAGLFRRDGVADQAVSPSWSFIEELVGSRRAILIERLAARRRP